MTEMRVMLQFNITLHNRNRLVFQVLNILGLGPKYKLDSTALAACVQCVQKVSTKERTVKKVPL